VGGSAQIPAMKRKEVAGGLRLALAAFRELEAFAQLGTDLDVATQSQLDRGYRMTELLKQGLYRPLHVTDEVLSIFAGTQGFLDKVAVTEVGGWIDGMLQFIHENRQPLWQKITDTKQLDDEAMAAVKDALSQYQRQRAEKQETASAAK
jgi:F-type H+/Na+-transporting ATPase subunit alpha